MNKENAKIVAMGNGTLPPAKVQKVLEANQIVIEHAPDYILEYKPKIPLRVWDKEKCDYCDKRFTKHRINVYADERDARPMCNDCYLDAYGDFEPEVLDIPAMGWERKNVKRTPTLEHTIKTLKYRTKDLLCKIKFRLSKNGREYARYLRLQKREEKRMEKLMRKWKGGK